MIKIVSTSLSWKRMLAWISHSSFQKIVKLQKASLALNVPLTFPGWPILSLFYSWVAPRVCSGLCVCVCGLFMMTCGCGNLTVAQSGLTASRTHFNNLHFVWKVLDGLAALLNSSTFIQRSEVKHSVIIRGAKDTRWLSFCCSVVEPVVTSADLWSTPAAS